MSASGTIVLAGLSRPFQLGMLYDCRKDVLIPGITLWDGDMLKKNINIKPQPNTEFKIIGSDSTESKAEALNVCASLEASFMSGLVHVKGSAGFLNDKKKSKQQSRVTLQYRATTRFEQLTMEHLGTGNFQHCNVFQEGSATHVVTAILYGANAFFVFDRAVSSDENHHEIQGSLEVAIQKIPFVSIKGEASLKMTETEQQQSDKFNCTFHGDFALENNPVSFQDAIKVYSQLPQLLGENGEHAVPMTVWLYPLKNLDSAAAQLVREISVGLVRHSQRILDEIDEADIECQDLMKDEIAIHFSEITTKLRKFKDLISEYKLVFQKKLCKLLPTIRGGGTEEQELVTTLNSRERSPFQSALITEYLSDREREMNVIRSYLEIMKEIRVIKSSSELDKVVLNPRNDFVVACVFSSLSGDTEYLQDLENYLKDEAKATKSDTSYEAQSASREEQWFRSGEVTALTRQSIRLFLDFKQSNQDRENIEFCIASVPNKSITASSIHVYEKGTLIDSQFLLPSTPPSPTLLRQEHDRVHLQIHPPATGEPFVDSYRILYQTSESDWKEIGTDGKVTDCTVSRLQPHTEYRFRCKAVCRPGVTLASDATEFIRTRPCSPPGPPQEKRSGSESITITWDIPTAVGEDVTVISYDVEYRQHMEDDTKTKPWECVKSTTREGTLEGLKMSTTYNIRVLANTGKSGKSLPSPERNITTLAPDTKPPKKKSGQGKSEYFMQQSNRLEKGNPSVYQIELERKYGENVDFLQYMFGRKVEDVQNKVILLLGSTGAGKTTLVNVMINYILGVKWEDQYRFKLIHEVTNKSQAESQTSVVTSYELYNQPGFQIPYSLTIIDTPGFGDTRGMAQDKLITEQVKSFLCSPLGVDHIDAVCFVVQASLARLSANQKYIFDSILSIFGKDIGENIMVLVTFVDSDNIPVLEAIKAAELPCQKNKKGQPTHFKFNNSTLYVQKKEMGRGSDEDSSDEDEDDDEQEEEKMKSMIWSTTFKQMKLFFKALGSTEGKDLEMTKKVLEERERLENATARLTPQITAGLAKLSEIKSFKQCLENEDEMMAQNKEFETEVEVLTVKRNNVNFFATNCNSCLFTCHSGCFLPEGDNLLTCAVMDDDGNCVVCPNNCSSYEHLREKALWTYETKMEKKTIKELKDNFMKAQGKFMDTKQMLEKLEEDFHTIEEKLMYLIKLSSNCMKRLNEIALKPSSMSTFDYIEILIRTEEEEKKPGFEGRIIGLKKMKQEAEILHKIARGEDVLPQERRMVKHKLDRMKKTAEKVKQMNAVLKDWPKGNEES
ncbi:uncharacterized protein LOC116220034 [Clupea harengus]|uniref:Uncharacterized protein LOC116220034 n=1 Tax=Clupea harengus TaxID=7950 RepID=A0A6P8FCL0_CLUHA|nr:uncharacterized protein LOC116220034 [Clupea harengus]